MDIITTSRLLRVINFADYLLFRKALFAWQQSHYGVKYIAKSHFKFSLNHR